MNYRKYPDLINRLASEYVLGTLRHQARRRFEYWMAEEPMVKDYVEFWQNKLHPLMHAVQAVNPPPRVWKAVENVLFARKQVADAKPSWWDNTALWRWFGGAALASAMLLTSWVVLQPSSALTPTYIAVLHNAQQQTDIVVSYDASRAQLQLAQLQASPLPSDKDLELWMIKGSDAPVSLGVLARDGRSTVTLRPDQLALLQQSQALAVSLEPGGGSPTGAPTGPVLWSGAIAGKV